MLTGTFARAAARACGFDVTARGPGVVAAAIVAAAGFSSSGHGCSSEVCRSAK